MIISMYKKGKTISAKEANIMFDGIIESVQDASAMKDIVLVMKELFKRTLAKRDLPLKELKKMLEKEPRTITLTFNKLLNETTDNGQSRGKGETVFFTLAIGQDHEATSDIAFINSRQIKLIFNGMSSDGVQKVHENIHHLEHVSIN